MRLQVYGCVVLNNMHSKKNLQSSVLMKAPLHQQQDVRGQEPNISGCLAFNYIDYQNISWQVQFHTF